MADYLLSDEKDTSHRGDLGGVGGPVGKDAGGLANALGHVRRQLAIIENGAGRLGPFVHVFRLDFSSESPNYKLDFEETLWPLSLTQR